MAAYLLFLERDDEKQRTEWSESIVGVWVSFFVCVEDVNLGVVLILDDLGWWRCCELLDKETHPHQAKFWHKVEFADPRGERHFHPIFATLRSCGIFESSRPQISGYLITTDCMSTFNPHNTTTERRY